MIDPALENLIGMSEATRVINPPPRYLVWVT